MKTCKAGLHQYENATGGCLECKRQRSREWGNANKEKRRANFQRWCDTHPGKHKEYGAAWREAHREYLREEARKSRENHPERVREASRRRRARIRGNGVESFSAGEWAAVVTKYGGLCAYCGDRPWEHMDHVVPIALGGPHSISNVVPACAFCNRSKGANVWTPRSVENHDAAGV